MNCPACGGEMKEYSRYNIFDCRHGGDVSARLELTRAQLTAIHARTAAQVEAACAPLVAELENIQKANTKEWDEEVRGDFKQWAQSRAGHALAQHRARKEQEPHPLDIIKPADTNCRRCKGSGWYTPSNTSGVMQEPCRCRKEKEKP